MNYNDIALPIVDRALRDNLPVRLYYQIVRQINKELNSVPSVSPSWFDDLSEDDLTTVRSICSQADSALMLGE